MRTVSQKMAKNLPKVTQVERRELGHDSGMCSLTIALCSSAKGREE